MTANDGLRTRMTGWQSGALRSRWLSRWTWREGLVWAWTVLLAVLLLGPSLGPGFTLSYDMVFVPRQSLLPEFLGLQGGLPRAVPLDAVVAAATTVIDGAWLQHLVLLAIPILAGLGVARLVSFAGLGAQLISVSLVIWNPFVIERLVQGHWALLLAYALLPWAIATAMRIRRTGHGWIALIWLCAGGSLVPSGGILLALVTIPIAFWPPRVGWARSLAGAAAVVSVNLPWILPALLHPNVGAADPVGAEVFALRSEGPWGPWVTALGGGGLWNAEVVPASRGTVLALVLTLAVLAAAALGWSAVRQRFGIAPLGWLTGLAAAGLLAAGVSATWVGPWTAIIDSVPGGGLARDSQKLLAPLVLLLAILAGPGIARVSRRIADRSSRAVLLVACAIIPLALIPDGVWGVQGRLTAVEYPAQWSQMREAFSSDPEPGDVIVLPWSNFRRFDFNANRTILDPAPRWLPRSSIASDTLAVARDGRIEQITGDDPRSAVVDAAIAQGRPLVEIMRAIGARFVLLEVGQRPEPDAGILQGLEPAGTAGDLVWWTLPAGVDVDPYEPSAATVWILAVDAAVLLGLLATAGVAVQRRIRRGHAPG